MLKSLRKGLRTPHKIGRRLVVVIDTRNDLFTIRKPMHVSFELGEVRAYLEFVGVSYK